MWPTGAEHALKPEAFSAQPTREKQLASQIVSTHIFPQGCLLGTDLIHPTMTSCPVELVPSVTYLINAGTGRHSKPEVSVAIKLANVMESTFQKGG
jgi:hypothetical protein